jgi:hypothetical protein
MLRPRYRPQITSWSQQRMRVLWQCTVPRAQVMFVTVQRGNIRPSKREMNKAVTVLKLSDVCSLAVNHHVSLSLTNRKCSVQLHALYSPRIALRTFTPRRDQLVIYGQYCTHHNLRTVKESRFTVSSAWGRSISYIWLAIPLLPGQTLVQGQIMTCCECGSVVVRLCRVCLKDNYSVKCVI